MKGPCNGASWEPKTPSSLPSVGVCTLCGLTAEEHPEVATASGGVDGEARREPPLFLRKTERKESEGVNHPAHYGGGENPYETIKVLKAWMTREELIGFCKGNAIKYLSRAGKKETDDERKDAEKARWYTNYMIEELL